VADGELGRDSREGKTVESGRERKLYAPGIGLICGRDLKLTKYGFSSYRISNTATVPGNSQTPETGRRRSGNAIAWSPATR
jgi:hypothetical protein